MQARTLIALALCVAVTAQTLAAQTGPEPLRDWNRVLTIQPGRSITVETRQPKRKLKGTFISADDAGITIQLRGGGNETIPKQNARKIVASRNGGSGAEVLYDATPPSTGKSHALSFAKKFAIVFGVGLVFLLLAAHELGKS